MISLNTSLLPHQEQAVKKLLRLRIGALYMEMGTGKTRTALELAYQRFQKGKIERVLWLCPCSVKKTISNEIIKHVSGDMSIFQICGIETLSSSIKTNVNLRKFVEDFKTMLIVDESTLIKNHKAKRSKNIMALAEKCPYRLILNGTPVSQTEADLFSQWLVLDWRILGYQSFWSFSANHIEYDEKIPGKIKRCLNIGHLTDKIAPYTFQILKKECLNLPGKTYKTVYYEMRLSQKIHYDEVAHQLLMDLNELEPHTIYRLFSGLQSVISGFEVWEDINTFRLVREPFFKEPEENPRIEKLLDIISRISGKIVIYCKYTQEIQDITRLLNEIYGEGAAVPFYGGISQKKRQENIEKFEKEASFFVANKSCAGYGLNLQFCNYLIFYNNDWSYATRAQAEDRVHRIGQENNVHIIDICAENTLDERILSCLSRKESMVDSFKSNLASKNMDDLKRWINGDDANA